MMTTKAITYEELLTSFRKGLRTDNWRKLNFLDKALYRAKRMGYYTNILARLGITKVQIRLIAKELERIQDFDSGNVYSMTRSEQEKLFINAVKKYSKVREDTIRAFL